MNIQKINSQQQIRNFSIIAHIDHGKSTLADRILEITNTVEKRIMNKQFLDSMDLEKERGITIKLNTVQIVYHNSQGIKYNMNLIDTPGHVDFNYEVSRALVACEGVILIIDATQGIQAQTLANFYLAKENNLTIIPVINKIDLINADVQKVKYEIINTLKIKSEDIILASGKTGQGVKEILEKIVSDIKPPQGKLEEPLKALVFDSFFDPYKGVVSLIRIFNGILKKGDQIRFMSNGEVYEATEVGIYNPHLKVTDFLSSGEVGYCAASIKKINKVRVGDTITHHNNPTSTILPGYRQVKPVVFCGLFPIDTNKYELLNSSLEKLKLNDAALTFEPETSVALGLGYRMGFLGILHMEIIQERIKREFGIEVIATAPSVVYHVYTNKGDKILVENPSKWPITQIIDKIEEPFIKATIICPQIYIGNVMTLSQNKRGTLKNIHYPDEHMAIIMYSLPLAEIMYDYFDQLKSITKGYASFEYEIDNYKQSELQKMDILLNSEVVDALSIIVHKSSAYFRGKIICAKLKECIPKQMFEVPIQIAVGKRIIVRENIKSMRKDVIAKCYGGDVSRKKKLLTKQKEGKKKMKNLGKVKLPQKAFLAILASK